MRRTQEEINKIEPAGDGDRLVRLDERWRDVAVDNKWSERCRRWSPDDGRDHDGGRCYNERGEYLKPIDNSPSKCLMMRAAYPLSWSDRSLDDDPTVVGWWRVLDHRQRKYLFIRSIWFRLNLLMKILLRLEKRVYLSSNCFVV